MFLLLLACSSASYDLEGSAMCDSTEPADPSSSTAYDMTIQDFLDRGAQPRALEYTWDPTENYLALAPLLATVTITEVVTDGLEQCFSEDRTYSSAVTTGTIRLEVDAEDFALDVTDEGKVYIQDAEIGFQLKSLVPTPGVWDATVLDRIEVETGTRPTTAPEDLLLTVGFAYEGMGGAHIWARADGSYELEEDAIDDNDAVLASSQTVSQR